MTCIKNIALSPKSFTGFSSNGTIIPISPVTAGTPLVLRVSVWKTWTDVESKGFMITCGGTTITEADLPKANIWTITPAKDADSITFTALNDGKYWRADNLCVCTADDWKALQTYSLPKDTFNKGTMPIIAG
ncbi:hypothetical protein D2E25_0236 [Bifidobacterium goeldii]|uniref:Uncharacterized protein n=1 Tax=Bifidobacterium goeldii TaxID=2306975 RepID=A0A430FMC8_9BIFI|nr:hypothetical protein [Bifidobacterium goeldii]RSX53930.1 hypothetical protein D2E25_0236 [Bifidobacterium goeldii]